MDVKVSRVEADRVEIPVTEYNALVRASERISAVERYVTKNTFISTNDIMAILGIKMP